MAGKSNREAFWWGIPAALEGGIGLQDVIDELGVRKPVNALVAGETINHQ
jgi:hypothetical protein